MNSLRILLTYLVISAAAFSATIYVPDDYPTIQQAIDAAVAGDTVLVAPATYVENITFLGKAITVQSLGGPGVTAIDGNQNGSVVTFDHYEWTKSVLEGFTIQNGLADKGSGIHCKLSSPTIKNNVITANQAHFGGGIWAVCDVYHGYSEPVIHGNIISNNVGAGIFCDNYASPLILDNTIMGNVNGNKEENGGGIYCHNSTKVGIMNNLIQNNSAEGKGGGIYAENAHDIVIIGNLISGNSATKKGGAIACEKDTDAMISSNTIVANTATKGGGLSLFCLYSTTIHVENNLIFKNKASDSGGGIFFSTTKKLILTNNTVYGNSALINGGGFLGMSSGTWISTIEAANTIFWENSSVNGPELYLNMAVKMAIHHCDVKGGKSAVIAIGAILDWGAGMIDADPLFVDASNGDYHLRHPSPCRDAGDNAASNLPTEDFEGDPRIAWNGTVDMGADEFYTHLYWTGDATPGGNVEIKFVGLPGTTPVGLCIGTGVLDPPLKSIWGDWYLKFPILGPMDMGTIPSPEGVLVISGTIPASPAPYSIPMQALIGAELTNLSVLEVK